MTKPRTSHRKISTIDDMHHLITHLLQEMGIPDLRIHLRHSDVTGGGYYLAQMQDDWEARFPAIGALTKKEMCLYLTGMINATRIKQRAKK